MILETVFIGLHRNEGFPIQAERTTKLINDTFPTSAAEIKYLRINNKSKTNNKK